MKQDPFFTETRVYVIHIDNPELEQYDTEDPRELNDDEFIAVAEEEGGVYSLDEFQAAYNDDNIWSPTSTIRILTQRATAEIHYTDQFRAIDW